MQPARFGTALLTPSLPRVWDYNALRVERLPRVAPVRRVAAEAERVLGGAGLGHRRVECDEEAIGARLAPGLVGRGWSARPLLVMAWRGPAPPAPGAHEVREVSFADLRAAYAEMLRHDHPADGETVRQLVAAASRARGLRWLAGLADGRLVSFCRLYESSELAQVEDVGTLPAFRRRGVASAVVLAAVGEALAAGRELVFLLAEERDWPRRLYARLGFVTIGRQLGFTLRPPR